MQFDLCEDGKICFTFRKNNINEAIKWAKKEIAGDGEWPQLSKLDPSRCSIKTLKLVRVYYNLDGQEIDLPKKKKHKQEME